MESKPIVTFFSQETDNLTDLLGFLPKGKKQPLQPLRDAPLDTLERRAWKLGLRVIFSGFSARVESPTVIFDMKTIKYLPC